MPTMPRLLWTPTLEQVRRLLFGPESFVLAMVVALVELLGPTSADDVDDVVWVLLLPMLFMFGCSMARYRSLPLTTWLLESTVASARAVRDRLVLSLGLDFHPERSPRLPRFSALHRASLVLVLVAVALWPARGILRELLEACRVRGLYTVYIVALLGVWTALLAGIVVMIAATVLSMLEVVKRRVRLDGVGRVVAVALFATLALVLLMALHTQLGLDGCLELLALACLLPAVVRPVDPPRGPWLNIAMGRKGLPSTARLGELLRQGHRLAALACFVVVALLAPTPRVPDELFVVTHRLATVFGWAAVWLFTGGAMLAVGEFNRRRRLHDPAFPRSKVLWAVPGPEASSLEDERAAIEAAGWRLVVSDQLPGPDDADLLVGVPSGGVSPPSRVPVSRVPPSLFLLAPDPRAVLAEAEERDKAERAVAALERLLVSARPRLGDRGEGTFLVPHCWLVVGLTRDDERGHLDRNPPMTFGHGFRAALGTRLRRFVFEVMERSGVDVLYVEDAVTPRQVGEVLEVLFERHVGRADPPFVSEHDFVGVQGVRVVLHDVDPEGEGIAGVDAHVTRNAISRARIMIVGRDRRDGDDDDDGPDPAESSDLWLREALTRMFPRLQPV